MELWESDVMRVLNPLSCSVCMYRHLSLGILLYGRFKTHSAIVCNVMSSDFYFVCSYKPLPIRSFTQTAIISKVHYRFMSGSVNMLLCSLLLAVLSSLLRCEIKFVLLMCLL